MPMSRRRGGRSGINIWPGFVDALASLLLVIIFVLLAFVLTQFYLGQMLSGRDQTISRLSRQLNELTDLLDIERRSNAELKVNIGRLTDQLQASTTERDQLQGQLNQNGTDRQQVAMLQHDVDALKALKEDLEKKLATMGAQAGDAQGQLAQERKLSEEARAEAALLHQQMEAMRQELARITAALEASESLSTEQKVQIADLGKRLNAALASKVEELARYRSEFFGRLRKVLGDRQGVRIEGDRFIFQSELLFASGSAELGVDGQTQLGQLARSLIDVTKQIPGDINWVLRIDGHTDKVPIKSDKFPSNWELSTARAVSVVKFLAAQGIPQERLAAAGFGEFQPVDKGDDEAARKKNRRIEIRLDQR
ncbi:peptidoglycan -binding protein [Telmatospirillum sp.]|uniref:peptidoglycan -binding protein n=1 Tax=Telmatospirillum sp. TaxID=2079197 RepID=UPI00284CED12|nr:peptidoglycan -binding protein [Telmatospirillum sp.]MDR3437999.1 peptidoglycan -binding protein [Telmatospirillum sp.]